MESNNQNTNELANISKKIEESRQQRTAITDWENQGIKKKEMQNGQTIVEKIRPVAKHVLTQLINRINKKEVSTSLGTLFKMLNRTKESLRVFGDTEDGDQYATSNYMQSRSQREFADHSTADIASMIEALNQHVWSNEANISQNHQHLPPSILMLRREVIKYAVRVELNNIISNQMMPSLSQKGIEKLERKAVSKIEEICQNSNLNQVNEFQSEIEPQNQIINFLTSNQTNTTLSTAPSSQDSNIIIINPYQDSQYESAEKPKNPKAKQKKDEQSNRLEGSMNSGMSNVVNINQNQLHQEFLEDRNKSNSKDTMNG